MSELVTVDRPLGAEVPADVISPKQLHFMRNSFTRVNVCEGSIRSGKTIITLLRWLVFVARAPFGGELVMIGRTRDAIWRNCIGPLQNVQLFGKAAFQVVGNYGAPTVRIMGRVVHVLGASDAKAEKVIRGMTVAGAYVDEITVIPEEFFTQLLGRMSVPKAKLFGTSNPDSPAHWLKRKFLDRIGTLADWSSWHFTLDDNPALTEAYKNSIRQEFTGLWYRRFILGEWVAAEGAIYDMWEPEKHIIPWDDLPEMRQLLGVGIDYGTTNATTALMLGLGEDNRLYMVDEWRYDAGQQQMRFTDAQLSDGIRTWMGGQHLPYVNSLRPEWTIVDPAAASFKVQLAADGLTNVINGDNNVLYGIRTTASLLSTDKLKISSRCEGFIQEAPGYSWDNKATEKGEDKPMKVADHSLDGGRYVIATTETNWRDWVDLAA
ncbi:PBSX family phage terminase large subunit [Arthrobacter sp. YN]|uniref:PBSX family phage terminase large subunit n=1 Tax=Arthrobacter sp. YN TaxID=2020486 RepID=UPI001E3DF667|nr:PBSX family phage terminase large subunit [Arthrobacter sp. YN]